MKKQYGFSILEMIIVALVLGFILMIVFDQYRKAVQAEKRTIAQQALMTVVGLQERWFIKKSEYARSIDQVGGSGAAGDSYRLNITQDPCGTQKCFTVMAVTIATDGVDRECEKMSINNTSQKKAVSWDNRDTTKDCWRSEH